MDPLIVTAALAAIAAQIYLSPIPEVSSIKVLATYVLTNFALFIWQFSSNSIATSIIRITILNLSFLTTATSLTLIRRAFFSPLKIFPGPPPYALTNLFRANLGRTGKGGYAILDLHNKYDSDIIRLGPNEISIRNVEAVERLYKGKYPRGTLYDAGGVDGATTVNTERNYKLQTPWRKAWEKGFAPSQFKDYNPRVELHTSKLVEVIKRTEGKEVNILKIMENYAFDIMADLSFAHDAGMQNGTRENDYIDFIHKYMAAFATIGALRPLHAFLPYFPKNTDLKNYQARSKALISNRLKLGKTRKDIFTHLLEAEIDTPSGKAPMFSPEQLYSNSNTAIIAGTDTTATTMTQLFRALALNPRIQKKLQEEIDHYCGSKQEITIEDTKDLGYTAAVVNEALRLFHPLPSGVYAATPPSGLTIPSYGNPKEENFIPGNVQVMIPSRALMTDGRYFPKGDDFIPERWTEEWSEGVVDRRAFIPFGYGVHSCVGKQLALNEMRIVLASVVKEWEIVLGEKYDEVKWGNDLKDYCTMKVGDLWGSDEQKARVLTRAPCISIDLL